MARYKRPLKVETFIVLLLMAKKKEKLRLRATMTQS